MSTNLCQGGRRKWECVCVNTLATLQNTSALLSHPDIS